MINTDDLCDAQGVADLAGLRHPNSVHTYLRRYADMPRPVIDLGPGRPRLWLRPQIEAWLSARAGNGAAASESVPPAGRRPAPAPAPALAPASAASLGPADRRQVAQ